MTTIRAPLALAALALALPLSCAAQDFPSGPPVSFSRTGDSVCASYSVDGAFDLYRDRILARSGGRKAELLGLPPGREKLLEGTKSVVMERSFKACAKAESALAPVLWIDQSCMSSQGVCLPPRGFEIDARGRAAPLSAERVAPLFAARDEAADPKGAAGGGWGLTFKPR